MRIKNIKHLREYEHEGIYVMTFSGKLDQVREAEKILDRINGERNRDFNEIIFFAEEKKKGIIRIKCWLNEDKDMPYFEEKYCGIKS